MVVHLQRSFRACKLRTCINTFLATPEGSGLPQLLQSDWPAVAALLEVMGPVADWGYRLETKEITSPYLLRVICSLLQRVSEPYGKAEQYSGRLKAEAEADIRSACIAQAWVEGFVNYAFKNVRAFDNLALLMLFAEMAHFDPIELLRLEVQCSKLDEMVKKHGVFPHASVDADRQQAQTPRARRSSLGNWVLKNG